MKNSTLKTKKLNDTQNIHLNKKKCIDSVDTVYKEAVFKLKYLLAESYTLKSTIRKPLDIKDIYQVSNIKIVEPKQEAIKKCVTDNSELKNVHRNIVTDLQVVSPELIIKQQKLYIQQLEQESQFCRKQLINLLYNVQETITENETLHYKNRTELCKDTFDSYITINEIDKSIEKSIQREKIKNKEHKRLENPNIIFESKISQLGKQLNETKNLELYKRPFSFKQLYKNYINNDVSQMKAQLVKDIKATCTNESVQHTCQSEMKMQDLQKSLVLTQNEETRALQRAKQFVGPMQETIFEKCQCEAEIKGLKKLDEQHKKHNQQDEKMSINTVYHCHIANKSQLEIEEGKKELTELRTELSQKETFINNLKMEFQQKILNLQSKLNEVLTEKDIVERELLTMKSTAKQHGKEYCEEQNKFQLEIYMYKERLERANAELDQYRRENLKLSEQLASLKEEININKYIYQDSLSTQILSKLENNKLTSTITDPVVKHEKVTARNVTRAGKVTSVPNKKHTVKVDLKVKVIPKQK
ncbi:unnamed protein product [Xylocopa violacea]|uniref:Uncharacterized protein n=1 Tax=Xylocopa violacea TaxID=135666 RepID=A0ABP1NYW0_XYLVO